MLAAPPETGGVDAAVYAAERNAQEHGPNKRTDGRGKVPRHGRRSTEPPLDAQVAPRADMMSWSTHIDAVAEETPLVSLRAGPSHERRRTLSLLALYASIFTMAMAMSLDAMSFNLYLNYACSEFNALSSMGTVMIVQQLVRAIAKPPVAKLSDVVGRIGTLLLVLGLYLSLIHI